jgi:formylglycine-generating enzyme required for sulfatase activity
MKKQTLLPLLLMTLLSCSNDLASQVDDGFIFVEGNFDSSEVEYRVEDLYVSPFETTIGEWEEFIQETNRDFDLRQLNRNQSVNPSADLSKIFTAELPIYYISWYEAVEYANWRSRIMGLEEAYEISIQGDESTVIWDKDASGYRLPTEAEWEYAANGGKASLTFIYPGSNDIDQVAWYGDNSGRFPKPVGLLNPNQLGIFDMAGNVNEWCWDFFDTTYQPNFNELNPTGPEVGYAPGYFERESFQESARVVKGGFYLSFPEWCAINFRAGLPARFKSTVGIRLVRNAE